MFGEDALDPLDADLTRQHEGEPLGERIVVSGRVLDEDGRPIRGALVEIWQANAAGRYRHEVDRHPAPLDPNFSGAGRVPHRRRRLLPLRHDQARRATRGGTTRTRGVRRTSTSRSSAARSRSAS